MKDDDLTPIWGALADRIRRTMLDVTKSKEEQHKNRSDQRICGRPGAGLAALHRGAGFRNVRSLRSI